MHPSFSIETAAFGEDEDANAAAFIEVFELMCELHKEGGYAPLDVKAAGGNVYSVMTQGMTFLARLDEPCGSDPAGTPIGVLALTEVGFWYDPNTTHLLDLGYYVRPEYRAGNVGIRLLDRARQEAQDRQKIIFIAITSPDRRPPRTRATLESQMAGFVPLGYSLRLN
jgi:GNAT superfamily N-acetyltransferase